MIVRAFHFWDDLIDGISIGSLGFIDGISLGFSKSAKISCLLLLLEVKGSFFLLDTFSADEADQADQAVSTSLPSTIVSRTGLVNASGLVAWVCLDMTVRLHGNDG